MQSNWQFKNYVHSTHWVQVTLRIGKKWIKLRPEGTMLRQPHFQIIAARKSTRMCSVVPQYTNDHLKSIIFHPPDWPGNDTTQMILGVLAHCQRVSSSPVRAAEILPPHWWTEWAPARGYIPSIGSGEVVTLPWCPNILRII